MDEKIEELAKEIQCSQEEENCFYCKRRASCCVGFDIALKVIKAGYRKERDTAKEICDLILEYWKVDAFVDCSWVIEVISEKYGVDLGE